MVEAVVATEVESEGVQRGIQPLFCYLQKLLAHGPTEPIDMVLNRIATLLDADAAGLSSPTGPMPAVDYQAGVASSVPPERRPWQEDAGLSQRVRGEVGALTHQGTTGSWLVSQVWEPRFGEPLLFWLWRAGKRPWTEAEAAALPIAGQTAARLALGQDTGGDGWHLASVGRHLEQAALVTSRLSHDFGNVLTGIMGFTELSLGQLGNQSPAAPYLQEVLDATRRGAAWIRKLHEFCRRNVPDHWPTSLPALVAEQETRLQEAGGLRVSLKADLPASLPLLDIDTDSLRHVLTQLIDNARDAVKENGTIAIRAEAVDLNVAQCANLLGRAQPRRHVHLIIRDSGPGLSADARKRLFAEVFYSTKPRYRGLGLLMVYGILQRFGGGLRLESEPHAGTTAHVYLPVAALPEAPADDPLRGAEVLVVIDDAVMRESLATLFSTVRCRVTPAAGAHPALALYQTARAPFGLIVAELRLAHLPGFELARRIQDRDASANFVFVQMQPFTSASRDDRLKPFETLTRPFSPAALLAAARAALMRQRPGQTNPSP